MPIYEYEPVDRDCLMCEGRIEVIQGIKEDALQLCPYCGMSVRRLISRASIQVSKKVSPDQAAKKGFSTFRRAEKGVWEKVAGPDHPAPTETESDDDVPNSDDGHLKL
jgi:putative FmdB family regulatory protein